MPQLSVVYNNHNKIQSNRHYPRKDKSDNVANLHIEGIAKFPSKKFGESNKLCRK